MEFKVISKEAEVEYLYKAGSCMGKAKMPVVKVQAIVNADKKAKITNEHADFPIKSGDFYFPGKLVMDEKADKKKEK
jgi:hypothetical protein